eukprot:CAMPEP_0203761506 /NCGR_PEP_ID=MMETSP0098-20131031/14582_1 /ASSEMBLY_ACC=CAM_ASM_000208 /TAXON_ID=96639 /ORGANISM=" , Strain NY0313808BC1" /LENGTH=81 /DNA_ID=CAMNT_0050655529 /DNA_START=279 /DNA_END=521 /DNA_ORIENTATION=+
MRKVDQWNAGGSPSDEQDEFVSRPNLSSGVMYEEPVAAGDVESIGVIKAGASWVSVGLLQISDILGVGLLAMGGAFASLGW